jgi:hypothetical protein
LAPPHWHRRGGDKWDAGYETTAYFLDWLEKRYGWGTVREINLRMNGVKYDEDIFERTTGRPVGELWNSYCAHLKGQLDSPGYLHMGCLHYRNSIMSEYNW